ncbi:MAG TPA: cold-shock protein [Acidimicrobiia bacterium]
MTDFPSHRRGQVTAFDPHRGRGEIESRGDRFPFHCTEIADGSRTIDVGTAVDFEVVAGPLGRWEAAAIERR